MFKVHATWNKNSFNRSSAQILLRFKINFIVCFIDNKIPQIPQIQVPVVVEEKESRLTRHLPISNLTLQQTGFLAELTTANRGQDSSIKTLNSLETTWGRWSTISNRSANITFFFFHPMAEWRIVPEIFTILDDRGSFAPPRSSSSSLSLEYTVQWGFSSSPSGGNFTAVNQRQVIHVWFCYVCVLLKRFQIPVSLDRR